MYLTSRKLVFKHSKVDDGYEHLETHLNQAKTHAGFDGGYIARDDKDPRTMILVLKWESKEAFERFERVLETDREASKQFLALVKDLDENMRFEAFRVIEQVE